jgi:hypothetical protein
MPDDTYLCLEVGQPTADGADLRNRSGIRSKDEDLCRGAGLEAAGGDGL